MHQHTPSVVHNVAQASRGSHTSPTSSARGFDVAAFRATARYERTATIAELVRDLAVLRVEGVQETRWHQARKWLLVIAGIGAAVQCAYVALGNEPHLGSLVLAALARVFIVMAVVFAVLRWLAPPYSRDALHRAEHASDLLGRLPLDPGARITLMLSFVPTTHRHLVSPGVREHAWLRVAGHLSDGNQLCVEERERVLIVDSRYVKNRVRQSMDVKTSQIWTTLTPDAQHHAYLSTSGSAWQGWEMDLMLPPAGVPAEVLRLSALSRPADVIPTLLPEMIYQGHALSLRIAGLDEGWHFHSPRDRQASLRRALEGFYVIYRRLAPQRYTPSSAMIEANTGAPAPPIENRLRAFAAVATVALIFLLM